MKKIIFIMMTLLATLVIGCGGESKDESSVEMSALNEDQKYALAYMWHEEKLAYDIYLELNSAHGNVDDTQVLESIATMSETKHIASVEGLVEAYDINITNVDNNYTIAYSEAELRTMPVGSFAIDAVQNLYDALYAKGENSIEDALEVGCMVEVVDIDDLNHYIDVADDNQALVDSFVFLRQGSYKHYWKFNDALKLLRNSDEGCCLVHTSSGTTLDYCKTEAEYPR